MKHYEKAYRERVLSYRNSGKSLEETQKTFGVSEYAILSWERLLKEQGHLGKRPLNRGHKKLEPESLKAYVAEHPDAYQYEIAEHFGCSQAAVSKALARLDYTRKKRG